MKLETITKLTLTAQEKEMLKSLQRIADEQCQRMSMCRECVFNEVCGVDLGPMIGKLLEISKC